MQPTILQFGAGNIGRGFMGHVFTEAGFEVVFAEVAPEIVEALNERRGYTLRLVGPDRFESLAVGPVRAVDARDHEAVARELEACAFACTAVGVPALPHIAPALAAGIRRRGRPLDVLLCENQLHCSDLLRGLLLKQPETPHLDSVGLVESVVSRMVPVMPEEERRRDPLLVIAEDYPHVPVDRSAFVGPIPAIPALQPVDDFPAYFERKLFVHNLGHAVAAYAGHLRGCTFIHEAMGAPEIAALVDGAMAEAGEALARKHGQDRNELRRHREDLLRRFRNAALQDTVSRVGRDPARKLRAEDRLVGAAMLCLDWGVEPDNIVKGIAAGLNFDAPDDAGARALRRAVEERGFGQALLEYTGQRPNSELGRRVLAALDADPA